MNESQLASQQAIAAVMKGDFDPELPSAVRDALLDVILAWADLDMVMAFLAAAVTGLDPSEGADRFGRKVIADKLKVISRAAAAAGAGHVAAALLRISDAYPDKALLRKRIAHARCAGVRKSDPEQVIFLPYERGEAANQLVVEIHHLQAFKAATAWARQVHDKCVSVIDSSGFFAVRDQSA